MHSTVAPHADAEAFVDRTTAILLRLARLIVQQRQELESACVLSHHVLAGRRPRFEDASGKRSGTVHSAAGAPSHEHAAAAATSPTVALKSVTCISASASTTATPAAVFTQSQEVQLNPEKELVDAVEKALNKVRRLRSAIDDKEVVAECILKDAEPKVPVCNVDSAASNAERDTFGAIATTVNKAAAHEVATPQQTARQTIGTTAARGRGLSSGAPRTGAIAGPRRPLLSGTSVSKPTRSSKGLPFRSGSMTAAEVAAQPDSRAARPPPMRPRLSPSASVPATADPVPNGGRRQHPTSLNIKHKPRVQGRRYELTNTTPAPLEDPAVVDTVRSSSAPEGIAEATPSAPGDSRRSSAAWPEKIRTMQHSRLRIAIPEDFRKSYRRNVDLRRQVLKVLSSGVSIHSTAKEEQLRLYYASGGAG